MRSVMSWREKMKQKLLFLLLPLLFCSCSQSPKFEGTWVSKEDGLKAVIHKVNDNLYDVQLSIDGNKYAKGSGEYEYIKEENAIQRSVFDVNDINSVGKAISLRYSDGKLYIGDGTFLERTNE